MRGRYLTSLVSFGAKGVFAFLITYRLANSLPVGEFALWVTVFSFGMVLSVSDFGIGQLVLTTLHEKRRAEAGDKTLMTNAVAAMAILSVIIMVLTAGVFAFHEMLAEIRWKYLIVLVILLRLVFIPAGAALQAQERYHERKLIEAVSYAFGTIFVFWATALRADVSALLLGMNMLITLGQVATGVRAARLGIAALDRRLITTETIRRMFSESLPYFINNVSGLVIYGGFIAMSSFVLSATTTAELSLLHSLVFMHLFQVFELTFRTVQTRLQDEILMKRLKALVALAYLGCAALSALIGGWLFSRFFGKYEYSAAELVVYVTFAFLEIYYLMLISQIQMRSSMKRILQRMSLLKTSGFVVLLLGFGAMSTDPSLLTYSLVLTVFSLTMSYGLYAVRGRAVARH